MTSLQRDPERVECAAHPTLTEAEHEAPTAEQVDGRRVLRQSQRVAQGREQERRADRNPLGACSRGGAERDSDDMYSSSQK